MWFASSSLLIVCVLLLTPVEFEVRGAGAVPPGRCRTKSVGVRRLGLDPPQLAAYGSFEMTFDSVSSHGYRPVEVLDTAKCPPLRAASQNLDSPRPHMDLWHTHRKG